jgi:hypothetical protein
VYFVQLVFNESLLQVTKKVVGVFVRFYVRRFSKECGGIAPL